MMLIIVNKISKQEVSVKYREGSKLVLRGKCDVTSIIYIETKDRKQMPFIFEKINNILNDNIFTSLNEAPLSKDLHLLGANNKPTKSEAVIKDE